MTMYIQSYWIGSCGRSMVLTDSPELVNSPIGDSSSGGMLIGVVLDGGAIGVG